MLDDPEMSYESLCGRISEINPEANITPQSLEERINKQETVDYIKTVLEDAINEKIHSFDSLGPELLNIFSNVDLRDSTIISLNEKLADQFKGSGGNASSSAIKIDFVYNLKDKQVKKITLHEGNQPDQSLATDR